MDRVIERGKLRIHIQRKRKEDNGMDKKKIILISAIAAAVIAIAVVLIIVLTGGKESYRSVKAEDVRGDVTVERDGQAAIEVFEGMQLVSKDKVSVSEYAGLELLMDSDKHMYAEDKTVFALVTAGDAKSGKIQVQLIEGGALFEIEEKLSANDSFIVNTPNAVFSVRGTTFQVHYNAAEQVSALEVTEGVVEVSYADGAKTESVEAGEVFVVPAQGEGVRDRIVNLDEVNAAFGFDVFGVVDALSQAASTGDGMGAELGNVSGGATDATSYQGILNTLDSFIAESSQLTHDYIVRDYMRYDYDLDGEKELILYLGYKDEDDDFMRDVAFMDMDADGKVYLRATSVGEVNDQSFYCEYQGLLARYSWTTKPMESYLYVVSASADGSSLAYVLEQSWSEIVGDIDAAGMHPLPLYGEWELILD